MAELITSWRDLKAKRMLMATEVILADGSTEAFPGNRDNEMVSAFWRIPAHLGPKL